jgi:hypothetical protein
LKIPVFTSYFELDVGVHADSLIDVTVTEFTARTPPGWPKGVAPLQSDVGRSIQLDDKDVSKVVYKYLLACSFVV